MTAQETNKYPNYLAAKQEALKAIATVMAYRIELDVQPVFTAALEQGAAALGAPMACLHLADAERGNLNLVEFHQLDPLHKRAWSRLTLEGSTAQASVFREPRLVEMDSSQAPAGLGGLTVSPVMGAEIPVGTLSFLWPKGWDKPQDKERGVFLDTVGHLLGLAIEHAGLVAELVDNLNQVHQLNAQLSQANRRLEELSITDGLTGVFNHRHIQETLEQEIIRSRRQGFSICAVMSDLDHFKRVNDKLGHQAGDQALGFFADLLKNGVREVDSVGRYGGEEFLLILVDCGLEAGVAVAEKLRMNFQEKSWFPPFDKIGGLRVSMGVAQLQPGMSGSQLIARADEALYQAKQNGRNQVKAARPE